MNQLRDSTSPYLLQHADNPVAWWPWGPAALDRAVQMDKPILLSIGYSACHWCHVMAHESFEDAATAESMNQSFVNIKVDREERPDLDKIYQLAYQALAQQAGGWPLTMFLSPDDRTPFFGGTYFPKVARYGMPSFQDVLNHVKRVWQHQRSEIRRQNQSMREFLRSHATVDAGGEDLDADVLLSALDGIARIYDEEHGGFGNAPKFPQPPILRFLLEWSPPKAQAADARRMVLQTLRHMALGGVYDQLGGGFCRYSVDGRWMIPHFEKMGYDNAQLLPLYAQAAVMDNDPIFAATAHATGIWVINDLQAAEGGYFSSWDADSEGQEGVYYVWHADRVRALLDDEEYLVAAAHWGLDRTPNFEGKAWHLHVFETADRIAQRLGWPLAQVASHISRAREKLLAERETRTKPHRDEKVLTSWTGLMIAGMAVSGRLLDYSPFLDSACRALDYVSSHLWVGGRLLATARDGQAHLNAYLDDYAALLHGCLALLQSRWRDRDLVFARALADALIEHYADAENGGFFFTSHDHETLIQRPKPFQDDALPAGNALAAEALLRLGHLLAEPRYLTAAADTFQAAAATARRLPHAHCGLMRALVDHLDPPMQIILIGDAQRLAQAWAELRVLSDPRASVYALPPDTMLADRYPCKDGFTAYLCRGIACSAPCTTLEDLMALVRQ